MNRVIAIVVLLSAGVFTFGQNLETVMKNANKAMGLEKRNNIKHLQSKGNAKMSGNEAKMPFKFIQSKPDHVRIEASMFGLKAIQTYNGDVAWQLSPSRGMEAVPANPRIMEFIAAATAIGGPFSLNKDSKYTASYEGVKTFAGLEKHEVLWSAPEERIRYYINKDTWLVDGLRYEYKQNGGWYSYEYRIRSYQDFGGSKYPSRISAMMNGVEMLSINITDIEVLDSVDMEEYGRPSYEM